MKSRIFYSYNDKSVGMAYILKILTHFVWASKKKGASFVEDYYTLFNGMMRFNEELRSNRFKINSIFLLHFS